MNKWWNFKFRIILPQNQQPRWWIDIFVFDVIVRQILTENRDKIALWRVHRRANKDEAGHQFTFLCYTEDEIAKLIDRKIASNDVLLKLQNAELLEKYWWEEKDKVNDKKHLEAYSDKNWPIEIQRSWPFFIMGVSEMLLELIKQVKKSLPPIDLSKPMAEIEKYYSELNNRLSSIWQTQGRHAFFHHINALFAYKPLIINPLFLAQF